jgi:hypothetical protein
LIFPLDGAAAFIGCRTFFLVISIKYTSSISHKARIPR